MKNIKQFTKKAVEFFQDGEKNEFTKTFNKDGFQFHYKKLMDKTIYYFSKDGSKFLSITGSNGN